jgi:hypothetical protein
MTAGGGFIAFLLAGLFTGDYDTSLAVGVVAGLVFFGLALLINDLCPR